MVSRHTSNLMLALAASCGLTVAAPVLHAQQGGTPGPLGGVQQYNLGESPPERSFVIPRLSLQEVYDSNPSYATTTGASQTDAITSVGGGLSLQWMNRQSTLALNYSAQGLLYDRQTQPNGVVQQLGVTEKIALRRWILLIGENFSYLPNSAFGLGGLGFLGGGTSGLPGGGGLPGIGIGTGFNPSVLPTQSIVSPNVSELSSATVFQAQYFLNGTSSVNGSASVGFLHFFGAALLNSRDITARFGYHKTLNPRDTISFSYQATILDYPSGIPGFTSHYIQMGYRRLINKRLHLVVSAGPAISHFSPPSGQTNVPGGSVLVDWSAFATLDYALRSGSLGAQYNHGVAAGSGYFPGTTADTLTANFRHQLTRVWSVAVTGGYARNSSLEQTASTGTTNTTAIFNTWYGGASISRPLGHYSSLQFFYNASRQTGNTTVCVNGVSCGPIALTQTGGVSYTWSTRPFALQ